MKQAGIWSASKKGPGNQPDPFYLLKLNGKNYSPTNH
jgi:hypothetical protein